MKKEYFMLVYSVFFVVVCSFIAGAYFAHRGIRTSLYSALFARWATGGAVTCGAARSR